MRRAQLAFAALLAAAPAAGSVAIPATVEDLSRSAVAVVRGKVEAKESRPGAGGRRIYTFVTLRVGEVWKGAAPQTVVVRVPGGVLGDRVQTVHGTAAFDEGEEVVVFLGRAGEVHQVVGHAMGKFELRGDRAVPDLSGLELLDRAPRDGERLVSPMAVGELERRVRSAR